MKVNNVFKRKTSLEERLLALEKLLKALMDECSELKETVEEIALAVEIINEEMRNE